MLKKDWPKTLETDIEGKVADGEPLPIGFSGYRVTSNKDLRTSVERGRPRRGEFVCFE